MATTPSNRLKLTPSNSPFLPRPGGRSPLRAKACPDSRLSLKRVIGTTCASPTGFDAVNSSFAYVAGGSVVVVDVNGQDYCQRFFRARPTAIPLYSNPGITHSATTPSTPKANDSRSRASLRESTYGAIDWAESPSNRTWTSRERIKAATCLALSREGRYLAVGETGYAPRVLIYSLDEKSSDTPLVSLSEHAYGVRAVAWSPDSRFLASLGSANDGFLYVWKIDSRTGAAKLFQQNRCTSYIRDMIWIGNNLITLGVRHIKVWRIDERRSTSPLKQRFAGDSSSPAQQPQKTLPGRNVLLGNMIETTFACAAAIDESRAIICSETGDVCLFDDTAKQMKLTKVLETGFSINCMAIRDDLVYIGGKSGGFATLDLGAFLVCNAECIETNVNSGPGLFALTFLDEKMVTLDSSYTINVRNLGDIPTSSQKQDDSPMRIPGHSEPILGVEPLPAGHSSGGAFYSWSASGQVILWDIDGAIKSSFNVPLEQASYETDIEPVNQLTIVQASERGGYFITGDKLGILNIIDASTRESVLTLKVHSSNCQSITTYEDETNFLIASCGRDRTAQLIHRTSTGSFEHFQTLEFAARVAQVLIPSTDRVITCSSDRSLQIHDLITKEGDSDSRAAIMAKGLSLKASPASMTMGWDGKSVFISLLDRSISVYDLESGKLSSSFKCTDENGVESVVLDSLVTRSASDTEPAFLLGISNTDKSIRIYDAQTGTFMDREWGHTEAINGVTLVEPMEGSRRIVSVGSDGTIMIWEMDLQERLLGSAIRDPSPEKDSSSTPSYGRGPPLRRVLSKAELAEFQRPTSSPVGRKSPPRSLSKRKTLFGMPSNTPARTPLSNLQTSPTSTSMAAAAAEDTPSRRPSKDDRIESSPPASPKGKVQRKRSQPTLNPGKNKSNPNLRGFGSLSMATEQASRTLRAYRKKLASADPISQDVLNEFDQELRMTALALGDRATRTQAMSDSMLNGLLDQYSDRLVTLLDEKLKLNYQTGSTTTEDPDSPGKRPTSSGTGSSSSINSST